MKLGRAVPMGAALLLCLVLVSGPRAAAAAGHGAAPAESGPDSAARPDGRLELHVVRPGETLSAIAARYGTSVALLVTANELGDPDRIEAGRVLTVPVPPPGAAPVAGAPTRRPGQPPVVAVASAGPRRLLLWPARGPVSSAFGWRWGRMHEGIDIAAPDRSPVVAAAAGTVEFAGWLPGYGRAVLVDHGGGMESLYAHASRLLVRAGDRVRAGQTIALVGSSGFATGPHLHFEVRVAGRATDPLDLID